MAEHPEVIRQQMAETRASLTEKLEAVENLVSETVQSTTDAVSSTVEAVKDTVENVTDSVAETVANVKDTVSDTVSTVAETFNIRLQFERHPWLMFGGAVALGCVAGNFLGRKAHYGNGNGAHTWESHEASSQPASQRASAFASSGQWSGPQHGEVETRSSAQPAQECSRKETTSEPRKERTGWFWNEMNRLKNLGLGSLMGVVHDLVARSLPGQLGQKIAEEVNHLSKDLGAEPIRGLVSKDDK